MGMLDGITVLDLSSVGPAARASRWLADYGATVIKVGPRDPALQIEPPFHAYSAHRGMTFVQYDMKDPGDLAAFLDRVASADVVIESFRPGVVARLGIGYDDVKGRNPGIVYCSTSGYGQDGPRAQWAGHDLNYLAVTGFLGLTQRRGDGGPPIPGATVADSAGGGMHAVIAILAALVRRASTGEGAYLDVSVADGVLALMALHVDEYLATGVAPHNVLTGRYACYDTYQAADGGWLAVAAIEPRFWANLCRLLGLDRWTDHQTDDGVQDQIRADLRAVFSTKTRDVWAAELAAKDTCVSPVLDLSEVDVAVVDAARPEHGTFRQMAPTLAGTV
jgi:alpha-methylacyl-CoA racemase